MQFVLIAFASATPIIFGVAMLWSSPFRSHTWIENAVWALTVLVLMAPVYRLSRAEFVGQAGYWVTLVTLLLTFALRGYVRRAEWRWAWPSGRMSALALTCLVASQYLDWTIHRPPTSPKPLKLPMPISGARWIVGQGGDGRLLNHHAGVPAQRYALDVSVVRDDGRRADGLLPQSLNSYASYGQVLVAPCNGTIVNREASLPDLPIGVADGQNPAGNFVAIDCGEAVILLAHLQHGSVQPEIGARIQIGQYIGRIGNSGNTTEPHLHVHAVERNFTDMRGLLFSGRAVPMVVEGRFLVRGDTGGSPEE
jgi:hypothetical protein